jgi:hypothetical protein
MWHAGNLPSLRQTSDVESFSSGNTTVSRRACEVGCTSSFAEGVLVVLRHVPCHDDNYGAGLKAFQVFRER